MVILKKRSQIYIKVKNIIFLLYLLFIYIINIYIKKRLNPSISTKTQLCNEEATKK